MPFIIYEVLNCKTGETRQYGLDTSQEHTYVADALKAGAKIDWNEFRKGEASPDVQECLAGLVKLQNGACNATQA